jgi:hypothetical protein
MNKTKEPENRAYKVTLILLVGLAAFSTAMKDLNRLREMVSSVQELTSQWRGTDLVALYEKPISTPFSAPILTNESCPNDSPQLINSSAESGSKGIAPSRDIEIDSVDYETITKPEVGGKVELVGSRKANRSVPHLARARYGSTRSLKVEIAKRRDGHWPAHFEFKTPDRSVNLHLPLTMLTRIKADAPDTEVSLEFPLSLDKINRKQPLGKTDYGRREFMFKRVERSLSSRRAS